MKLEVLLASFICIGLASASLVDVLNSLHQNQNFKLLNQTAQILIVELIAATEANELKNYIDTVGFSKVLNMIDHLPSSEAHQLRVYLIQELQIEENQPSPVTVPRRIWRVCTFAQAHLSLCPGTEISCAGSNNDLCTVYKNSESCGEATPATTGILCNHQCVVSMRQKMLPTVGKRSRDIATLLKYVQQQAAYQNLPQDKQDFITRMLTAAENDTVTDFIAVEGYAAVLELIDVLPVAEGHTLDKYLLDHLSSEMGPAVGKK